MVTSGCVVQLPSRLRSLPGTEGSPWLAVISGKHKNSMRKIVDNQQLELIHNRGYGAWTYHLVIPHTADIEGSWGSLKVSGLIDAYEVKEMNLAPRKGADKMISINEEIRKATGKSGGDTVTVTLYLHTPNRIHQNSEIFKFFEDAGMLDAFQSLSKAEQAEMMKDIIARKTEAKQIEQINHHILQLQKWNR
jgi:hypothetical protein